MWMHRHSALVDMHAHRHGALADTLSQFVQLHVIATEYGAAVNLTQVTLSLYVWAKAISCYKSNHRVEYLQLISLMTITVSV